MSSRIPLFVAVVGALLLGSAATGGTHASWVGQRQLAAHSVGSGSMTFTATTPAGISVTKVSGATADTSFVVNDTSAGKNLKQRITAAVASTPAGISATVGTNCGSGSGSVSVDTTPVSGNQTLCVRVTSSATAASGTVTLSLSGAQRPTGWTTATVTRSFAVTVSTPTTPALTCGSRSGNDVPFTWQPVAGESYTVERSTTSADHGIPGADDLGQLSDDREHELERHHRVLASEVGHRWLVLVLQQCVDVPSGQGCGLHHLRAAGMTTPRAFATQVFSWMLLTTVILGAFALIIVPKATGARPLTVLSGSMTGTYDIGDVVIVRPVDPAELAVGDVITFQPTSDDPSLTTHRIVGLTYGSEGQQFVTQGDANGAVDLSPVKPEQVMGEVWYSVPTVGYLSVWLAGGWVRTALDLAAVGLLLYGGYFVASGLWERRRRKREDEDAANDPRAPVAEQVTG